MSIIINQGDKMVKNIFITIATFLLLIGCGGGGSFDSSNGLQDMGAVQESNRTSDANSSEATTQQVQNTLQNETQKSIQDDKSAGVVFGQTQKAIDFIVVDSNDMEGISRSSDGGEIIYETTKNITLQKESDADVEIVINENSYMKITRDGDKNYITINGSGMIGDEYVQVDELKLVLIQDQDSMSISFTSGRVYYEGYFYDVIEQITPFIIKDDDPVSGELRVKVTPLKSNDSKISKIIVTDGELTIMDE
jgi:hypothetical protein